MKPYILKIDGINSFNKMQEIDFSKVLNCGIFGILGDTGSGKSTIIDAITLSLYGKIARYIGDNKNGDFINLNRKDASVSLIFSIKEAKEEIFFEIIRKFKRDNKGSIKTNVARLSVICDGEYNIISDKKTQIDNKIKEIIGLSYDDFTRAVVLPQGKFSEFLMLDKKEKREMLQRIFGLEKYGDKLKNKINEKKYFKEKIVNNLKLQLEYLGDISENNIKNLEDIILEQKKLLKNKNNEIKILREEEKNLSNIYELKKGYDEYDNKIKELLKHKDKFENFQNILKLAEEVDKIFFHIKEKENILEQSIQLQKYISSIEVEFDKESTNFDIAKDKLENIKEKEKFDIPKLEELENNIIEYIEIEKELKNNQKNILEFNTKKSNLNVKKQEYIKNIEKLENEEKNIKNAIKNILEFNEKYREELNLKENLKNAIDINKSIMEIQKNISNLENFISDYEQEQNKLINKQKDNLEMLEKLKNQIIKYIISNKLNYELNINSNNKNIDDIIFENESFSKQIKDLEIQIKLQNNNNFMLELANSLTEGESCPLCGSKTHPNIFNIVSNTLENELNKQKQEIETKINSNIKIINRYKIKNETLVNLIDNIKTFASKYEISNFDKIYDEFIIDEDNILNKIYYLNEEISNLLNKNENIKINIQNIIQNKKQKQKELEEENKKLTNKFLQYKELNLNYTQDELSFKYKNILSIEKTISENSTKLSDINKLLEKNSLIISQQKNKLDEISKEELDLEVNITKATASIDELNNRKKINDIENPNEELTYVKQEINNLKLDIEKIEKEYKEITEKKDNILKKLEENKIKQKINQDIILQKNKYIDDFLSSTNNFENENDIKSRYKSKEEQEYCKEKIKSYTDKMSNYTINFNRFKKELADMNLNANNISLEEIKNKLNIEKNNLDKLEKEEKDIIEELTKLKIDIEKSKENLEKSKNIKENLKQEQKHLDILKELSEVNNGGVFLEYVANRQLRHIVLDASKRLSSMSLNKYSLELIDNNFYIKDNYNAGSIRSTKSLSGGELFMTSLSLALALSSNLQLKNKSPLEVFFLDEGFGTLDISTIDIVINTLEQLQTNNISVGIITHVEEIKNRVQNKILVNSSDTGANIKII